jgi:nitrogen regulatory protein PII
MMPFSVHEHYALVTAILPRSSAVRVLDDVLASGAAQTLTLNARGAVMQSSWWKSLLPATSPELELIHFLVPNEDAASLMDQIVTVGKLRLFGAGSIYAIPCHNLTCSEDFPLWQPGYYTASSQSFDIKFKKNLSCLIHITDRGSAEPVARAAIKAGAQGATITFVRGYGLRDRLGLLRITKSHDKELTTVIVDPYDRDNVFDAMSLAGRISQPGRGILFEIPVERGLTNLSGVFEANKNSATIQQMVRAIDELHGGSDWRSHHPSVRNKGSERAARALGLSRKLQQLNIMVHRKDVEFLLRELLNQGVSGASVSNWRMTERDSAQTRGGLRINREFGCVSLILRPRDAVSLSTHIEDFIEKNGVRETCHFIHEVPVVKSFARFEPETQESPASMRG